MAMQTLHEYFEHELRDIYYAEQRLEKALGKMSKHVNTLDMQQALQAHQQETADQIKRLEKVFDHIGKKARGIKCEGMLGLIAEHDSMMKEKMSEEVNEMMHMNASIKVERYEISAYEGLIQLAEGLEDMDDAVELLQQNLDEEYRMLENLQQMSGAASSVQTSELFEEEESSGGVRYEA